MKRPIDAIRSEAGLQAPVRAPSRRGDGTRAPSANRYEIALKTRLKEALGRLGIHVLRKLPRGVRVSHDLRRALPGFEARVVFDVGANVGQSARSFLREFPEARLVCFEPGSRHYAQLVGDFAGEVRVRCERLALGSGEGEATLVETLDPTMSHVVREDRSGATADIPAVAAEQVKLVTLDRYCEEQGIDRIDFLKIDTEGYDYEVIVGADAMLSSGRISVLQCECSMSPENTFHVDFDTIRKHLETKGMRLFGIYEQVHEWMARKPNLRRVNAVYLSLGLMHPINDSGHGSGGT